MNMEVKECTKEQWDSFVENSPQGTVYCRTCFLDSLELEYDLFMVVDNNEPQLGAIILRANGKVVSEINYLITHQGFLMKKDALAFTRPSSCTMAFRGGASDA